LARDLVQEMDVRRLTSPAVKGRPAISARPAHGVRSPASDVVVVSAGRPALLEMMAYAALWSALLAASAILAAGLVYTLLPRLDVQRGGLAETMAYYALWSGMLSASAAFGAGLASAVLPRLAVGSAGPVRLPAALACPGWLRSGNRSLSWAAITFLTAYLGFRWAASGAPPISNMWEYTVAFGWATLIGARVVDSRYRAWTLSMALLAGALVLFVIAEAAFSWQINWDVPAPHRQHLQARYLLPLHAGTMLVAFGAFGVAFIAAAAILVREFAKDAGWLPSRRTLEEITDRAVLIGFPSYTLGLAAGSYWLNALFGRYWDWDTKASSVLAAWLIYTAYLHARNLRRWRATRAPLLVITGFAALLFGYFGVNLFIGPNV